MTMLPNSRWTPTRWPSGPRPWRGWTTSWHRASRRGSPEVAASSTATTTRFEAAARVRAVRTRELDARRHERPTGGADPRGHAIADAI